MTKRKGNEAERMVVTRVFDAPRELVWKAYTDPKYVMQCGVPKVSRRLFARWIFASEESFSAA